MGKLFKDIKAGDTFYYLPGRAIADEDDKITQHTVSEIHIVKNEVMSVYCEDFNQGKYPLFSYPLSELETDSFFNKYGWYSTEEYGIQTMWNKDIDDTIRYYENEIEEIRQRNLKVIEELKSKMMSCPNNGF